MSTLRPRATEGTTCYTIVARVGTRAPGRPVRRRILWVRNADQARQEFTDQCQRDRYRFVEIQEILEEE